MAFDITLSFPDGSSQVIQCDEDTYILDAADEAGVDLPYSCRAGACSSCAGKLISGTVDNGVRLFLDNEQMDERRILTCVAYRKSDCIILVEQEENF